jgi:signal transduction histidine kinase
MFSFLMLMALLIYSFKYRHNVGGIEFLLALIGMAWWVFCQAFELMAMTLPVKLFWANIEYLGILAGLAYLITALRFAGLEQYVTKRNVIAALCIYAVFYGLLFTDSFHGLMRTHMTLDTSAVPYTIKKDYGMIYPLYLLWTYGVNLSAILIILFSSWRKSRLYRRQGLSLILCIAIISLTNLTYIIGISPVKRYDITPAITWIPALGLAWGIFRNRLLDIMPLARDTLVEQLNSGVIVVDRYGKIVDINNAAQALLHIEDADSIGKDFFKATPLPIAHAMTSKSGTIIDDEDHQQILEIRVHPFGDETTAHHMGTIFVITDVTEREQHLKALVNQQRAISVMEERERFGRDLHDSIGQMFGFVNTQTQAIKENLIREKYSVALFQTEALIEETQRVHGDIRNYILEMRGVSPRNRSFSAALKQYVTTFQKNHHIPVQIQIDDHLPESFPETHMGIQLLRIIQEGLNNVQKHAGPCQVVITIAHAEREISLSIKDTGRGFDVNKAKADTYGISIMRERAAEIGGVFSIHTAEGKGTEITVRFTEMTVRFEDA